MPFGLKNAPSVFQCLMNSMLADTSRFSAAYKEDIVVFGLANYYRRFIPGFGSIAVSLTESTRKQAPDRIEWMSVRLAAFQQLRTSHTEDSILVSPEEEKLFLLHTDCEVQGKNLVNTDYFMWLLWLFIVA